MALFEIFLLREGETWTEKIRMSCSTSVRKLYEETMPDVEVIDVTEVSGDENDPYKRGSDQFKLINENENE